MPEKAFFHPANRLAICICTPPEAEALHKKAGLHNKGRSCTKSQTLI
jgi:hypothetical protein